VASIRHALAAGAVAGLLATAATCDEGGETATAGGGNSGEGGCPTDGPPEALFTLKVTAMRGPVPGDTTVRVKWSAGEEPEFILDEPDSWKTLEQGSNLVCDIERDAGPPSDLDELRCELWTSGATEIEITAGGYLTHDETLMPKEIDGCDDPVPSELEVELVPDLDAGTGG
jgi:hypothetical protein